MAILLVRHAQSEANLDKNLFRTMSDQAIPLSQTGIQQAEKLGKFVDNYLSVTLKEQERVRLWSSSYTRTAQTASGLYKNSPNVNWDVSAKGHIFFDQRLREREFGYFDGLGDEEIMARYPEEWKHYKKMMQGKGRFFAKPYNGESGANVCDRLETFKATLFRDIDRHDGIHHHVIVNHGFTLRCFVTNFFHLHHDFFEEMKNPSNTAVRLIDKDPSTGRYADYGYIYDPDNNICMTQKPEEPIKYDWQAVMPN